MILEVYPSLRAFLRDDSSQRSLAFLFGCISALGFAPLFWWGASFVGFLGSWFLYTQILLPNLRGHPLPQRLWRTGIFGWCFGFGHFVVGIYWVANALSVDLAAFWWLIPFALMGLPALLALFISFPFMGASFSKGSFRLITFSVAWVGCEWLRGHVLTGFPWNLLGYIWGGNSELSQVAAFAGVYGLSLLSLFLFLSWEWIWKPTGTRKGVLITCYLIAGLSWLWGKDRLSHPNFLNAPAFAIRLVQPNIPQTLKWDPAQKIQNLRKILDLTALPSAFPIKAVLWPESAVPFFLEQEPLYRLLIASKLPEGALLFTGGLRRTESDGSAVEVWNSLLVMDQKGNLLTSYDKSHLVPFGEYLPFRVYLDKAFGKHTLKKMTAGTLDFTAGNGPQSLCLSEGCPSFSGLVCYEVIFPGAVIHPTQPRPWWMVNVTNDGWYGNSSGPYQHLESARFRAIEEGIPLVRVANSGISAVIDAHGIIQASLPLYETGILDVLLPAPLKETPPYGRWGDKIIGFLLLGLFFGGWLLKILSTSFFTRRQPESKKKL